MCYCLATPVATLNTGSCTSLEDFRDSAAIMTHERVCSRISEDTALRKPANFTWVRER